ncbi:HD domain-containing protein [Vibrio nigripulchritudo]|uniref:HD domain-containing protein n=1 Tax=Vibrio nigripulchritudo TaxID=28173 RepID=UPI0003B21A9D|nr:HD domain-containing protein [Vibrio nigripulchritudo]CCN73634.1 putative Metal-dependent HD phosphohydrolase [Vibrio nigripulchritudo SFn118]
MNPGLGCEDAFIEFIKQEMVTDAAHDLNHIFRVVNTSKALAESEGADLNVVLPAAYLHDCFTYPKDHPERHLSAQIAADKACQFLSTIDYPDQCLPAIHHAIMAHSFSAGVKPETLEAKVVQDADRLDSLGAIGVTRTIQVSATFNADLYDSNDMFAEHRPLDDKRFTIDHFQTKLFKIADTMNTPAAIKEAKRRVEFMKAYLEQLATEA